MPWWKWTIYSWVFKAVLCLCDVGWVVYLPKRNHTITAIMSVITDTFWLVCFFSNWGIVVNNKVAPMRHWKSERTYFLNLHFFHLDCWPHKEKSFTYSVFLFCWVVIFEGNIAPKAAMCHERTRGVTDSCEGEWVGLCLPSSHKSPLGGGWHSSSILEGVLVPTGSCSNGIMLVLVVGRGACVFVCRAVSALKSCENAHLMGITLQS